MFFLDRVSRLWDGAGLDKALTGPWEKWPAFYPCSAAQSLGYLQQIELPCWGLVCFVWMTESTQSTALCSATLLSCSLESLPFSLQISERSQSKFFQTLKADTDDQQRIELIEYLIGKIHTCFSWGVREAQGQHCQRKHERSMSMFYCRRKESWFSVSKIQWELTEAWSSIFRTKDQSTEVGRAWIKMQMNDLFLYNYLILCEPKWYTPASNSSFSC